MAPQFELPEEPDLCFAVAMQGGEAYICLLTKGHQGRHRPTRLRPTVVGSEEN